MRYLDELILAMTTQFCSQLGNGDHIIMRYFVATAELLDEENWRGKKLDENFIDRVIGYQLKLIVQPIYSLVK